MLDQTGTYTIRFDGPGDDLPSYGFTLHEVPATSVTPVNMGDLIEGSIDVPGERDRFTFAANGGDQLYFDAITGGSNNYSWSLTAPDGSVVFSDKHRDQANLVMPLTGTYTLEVDGTADQIGAYSSQIIAVPPPDEYFISIGDTERFNETVSGDIEMFLSVDRWFFDATAGDKIFIDMQALSGTLDYDLFSPSGVNLGGRTNFVLRTMDLGPLTLPEDGTYTLRMRSFNDSTPTYSFELISVPEPETFSLSYDTVHTGSIESIGAVDRWVFDGAAGERLFFDMQSLDGGTLDIDLFAPDGSVVFDVTNFVLSVMNNGPFLLPTAGEYVLRVQGTGEAIADSYGFQMWTVPDPEILLGKLDAPLGDEIFIPGERDLWQFELTAGQHVFFDMQINDGGVMEVSLTSPSGSTLFSRGNNIVRLLDTGPVVVPETGTYVLEVDGRDDARSEYYQFRLNDVTPEPPIPIAFNSPVSGAIDVGGRTRSYSFDAVAGQTVTFDMIFRQSSIAFTLLAPNGTAVFSQSSTDRTVNALPATGTYIVLVDQASASFLDEIGHFSFQIADAAAPPPLAPTADLVVNQVISPTTIVANPASFDITWTVTNQGTASTNSNQWIDRIILSADTNVTGVDDRIAADFTHTGQLAPGESYTRTETITLDPDFAADFRLAVRNDPLNAVFEDQFDTNNFRFADNLTAIYPTARNISGQAEIALDLADGTELPAGSVVTLSGNADISPGAVNAIFIVDVSGSTRFVNNLDANFDGVVNADDDINNFADFADVLDVELGAVLRVSQQLASQAVDVMVSVVPFGTESEAADLGYAYLNQTFADTSTYLNGNLRPDYEDAVRSVYSSTGLAGASKFRDFSFQNGTNFAAPLDRLQEILDIAPDADKTIVYFLSDGVPTSDPTVESLQSLGESNIEFHAFQITGSEVSTAMQNMASVIDAGTNSSGSARLVSDPEHLTAALLATLNLAGVTVDNQTVRSLDAAGNFFTPVQLQLGPNTFTVAAIDSAGNSIEQQITLIGVDPSGSAQQQDVTSRGELNHSHTTFNRQTRTLHVNQTLTNVAPTQLKATVTTAVDAISQPSVSLTTAEGTLTDGRNFFAYDTEFATGDLAPQEVSESISLEFANPQQQRFDVEFSLLANSNRAPFFSSAPGVQTTVDADYLYQAAAYDADGDTVTFQLLTSPNQMTVNAVGLIQWTPTDDDIGVHDIQIQADDGHGGTALQNFQLEVRATTANRPPAFRSTPITRIDIGTNYNYTADAFDADGDAVTYSLDSPPANMAIDPLSGLLTFDSPAAGDYAITVIASDTLGATTQQSFVLTVGDVATNPGAPVIMSTPVTEAVAGSLYLYLPLAQDPDGDLLIWSLIQAPTGMTIDMNSGRIDWTPAASQLGTSHVLLKVDDGRGGTATQFYSIEVSQQLANRAPLITSQPEFIATQDSLYTYNMTATDPEGDAITFALLSGPANLTVSPSGQVQWTPSAADVGSHRIRLSAVDSHGATSQQTFDLDVRSPNLPPEFTTQPITSTFAEAVYRYDADAIDSEDSVRFELVTAPSGMTLDPLTGQLLWTPSFGSLGNHAITLRAIDQRGASADQSFTLAVTIDDTPPTVSVRVTDSLIDIGETVGIQVLARITCESIRWR
ncbi:MAG: putative Ig domain-containing protein [Pirellulaceae bacterium]